MATNTEIMSRPYPKNVISEFLKIEDEDLKFANDVMIQVMIRQIVRNATDGKVIELRFQRGMTYDGIANEFGVSNEAIRQRLLKLKKIAKHPSLLRLIFANEEIRAKYRRR